MIENAGDTPQKRYYHRNKKICQDRTAKWREKNKDKIRNYAKLWRERYKEQILILKKDKCCAICGWKEHTEILGFHHRNPKEKEIGIGRTHNNLEKIKEEIKKCDLLCPNCHMWLHFKRGLKYG